MNLLGTLLTQINIVQINRERLSQVKPQLAAACFQIIEYVRSKGFCLVVAQGYRPPDIQDWLYEQGRTRPGDVIVNDRANECKYTTGDAVAFAFFNSGNPEPVHLISEAAYKLGLICSDGCDVNAPKGRHVEMPSPAYIMPDVNLVPPQSRALKIIAVVAVSLAVILILMRLFA